MSPGRSAVVVRGESLPKGNVEVLLPFEVTVNHPELFGHVLTVIHGTRNPEPVNQ